MNGIDERIVKFIGEFGGKAPRGTICYYPGQSQGRLVPVLDRLVAEGILAREAVREP